MRRAAWRSRLGAAESLLMVRLAALSGPLDAAESLLIVRTR